jgi:hypothetical protein
MNRMRTLGIGCVLVLSTALVSCSSADERTGGSTTTPRATAEAALVTVPHIRYGTSVDRARRILADAGLMGHEPNVNFPHYVTGTVPSAGSTVHVGDVIELQIGDG